MWPNGSDAFQQRAKSTFDSELKKKAAMEGEGTEEYVRISRLAEQIDPFLRTVVFCKLLQPGTHSLPPKVQMRIVQQHIAYMGLDKTLATLEEESKTTCE